MAAVDIVISGKYKLEKLIGEGAFGKIYAGILFCLLLARCLETNQELAVKLVCRMLISQESIARKRSQLLPEGKIYKLLQGNTGIPRLYWLGTEGEYRAMVMELLGPSLENLLHMCNNKLSLPTMLAIAEQTVVSSE